jgi:RNA polymerase sigma-70 factor, ECF subfamily
VGYKNETNFFAIETCATKAGYRQPIGLVDKQKTTRQLVTNKELNMYTQAALVKEIGSLKKFALKLTRSDSDADDLTQSTILRALEKKHLFQEDTNLFSWTSKIMYNIFVSEYRRKVRFETQYDPESYIERASVESSQEVKMEFKQVQEAMETLSEDHREILVMVCIKGMQYAEVSELLQIPVGTVRSRLSRARESLQTQLNMAKTPFTPIPQVLGNETRSMAA